MSVQQSFIHKAAVAIKEFIDANPLGKKTPSDLAAQFRVDRNKVLPVFKELTGYTIKSYQLQKLMHAASNMLLAGRMVKEVGIECGYIHYPTNFTRSFRKVFQIGPDEWLRKKFLEKGNSNSNEQF
jgi:AraC-like DNA-binding protein